MAYGESIGIYTDPGLFGPEDIALVRKFTDWMHNPRIKSLLNEMALPTASGGTFDKLAAPYLWMFVNAAKDKALLIGTSTERAPALTGNLRWLDSTKIYLLEDISLYNDGVVRYAFNGKKTGTAAQISGVRGKLCREPLACKGLLDPGVDHNASASAVCGRQDHIILRTLGRHVAGRDREGGAEYHRHDCGL